MLVVGLFLFLLGLVVAIGLDVVDSVLGNLLLNLLLVQLVEIAEVFLKCATLPEQQVEVVLTDNDIVHLWRNDFLLVLLPHAAIMFYLGVVGKALHNNQSQVAKRHGLKLKVLHHKR